MGNASQTDLTDEGRFRGAAAPPGAVATACLAPRPRTHKPCRYAAFCGGGSAHRLAGWYRSAPGDRPIRQPGRDLRPAEARLGQYLDGVLAEQGRVALGLRRLVAEAHRRGDERQRPGG